MLNILNSNEKIKISVEEARTKYTNSKVIIVLDDKFDISNLIGYLYAISSSVDSFNDLCLESNKLRKKGVQNIIVGTYNNGAASGVQHII